MGLLEKDIRGLLEQDIRGWSSWNRILGALGTGH